MKIFALGATGLIGLAVVKELIEHGHHVTGLSRSDTSDLTLQSLGCTPIRGDLRSPTSWIDAVTDLDAVIQMAATFEEDMGAVDARVVDGILSLAQKRSKPLRVVYTGGIWLYGNTGNRIATEESSFNPISAFSWMVTNGDELLNSGDLKTAIVHPARVYNANDGAFSRIIDCIRSQKPVDVWGSLETKWPLVHSDDLAVAYRLLVERPELEGHFNVCAEEGISVRRIVSFLSKHHRHAKGHRIIPFEDVLAEQGEWAEGPMLDQSVSSEKIKNLTGWKPKYPEFQNSDIFK